MIQNPTINGMNGLVMITSGGKVVGHYPRERMILRQYTGSKDCHKVGIWEWDKLYAKGNIDGEEYIGYVIYDEETAKFVVCNEKTGGYGFIPSECYVKGHYYEDPLQ